LPFAPGLLEWFQQWPMIGRAAASLLIVVPIGMLLGLPFPAAMAAAKGLREEAIPWMWAVNGAASVMGSLVAVVCAMTIGSLWIPVAASLCYLLAGAVMTRHRDPMPVGRMAHPGRSGFVVVALVVITWLLVLGYTESRYGSSPKSGSRVGVAPYAGRVMGRHTLPSIAGPATTITFLKMCTRLFRSPEIGRRNSC
jgi:hypothetical protein